MVIGFTGSRIGMSEGQKRTFRDLMSHFNMIFGGRIRFHHGDCVGSDETAHHITHDLAIRFIVIHPPIENVLRANCTPWSSMRDPLEYLDRNRQIVNECNVLIATPEGDEKLRTRTWSTIRYALKEKKAVYLIRPDGTIDLRLPIS